MQHFIVQYVLALILVLAAAAIVLSNGAEASAGQRCFAGNSNTIICQDPRALSDEELFAEHNKKSDHGKKDDGKKQKGDHCIMPDLKKPGGCWLQCDGFSINSTSSAVPKRLCTCDMLNNYVRFNFRAANSLSGVCPRLADLSGYAKANPINAHQILQTMLKLCQSQAYCKCVQANVHDIKEDEDETTCAIQKLTASTTKRPVYMCSQIQVVYGPRGYNDVIGTRPACIAKKMSNGEWICAGIKIMNPQALPWFGKTGQESKGRRQKRIFESLEAMD